MVQRICALPQCEATHYGNGYCRPHYRRFKRYGDPLGWKHTQAEVCQVANCDRPAWARDLCGPHYQRWRKHGDVVADCPVRKPGAARQIKPPRVRNVCTIKGCDGPAKGRGWCQKHYLRWRAHGNPEWHRPTYVACSVEDCGKAPRSAAASLCEAHYVRLRRNGTLDVGQCTVCQEPLPLGSMVNRLYCVACGLAKRRSRSRDQEHRRRALILKGDHERIDSLEIFERDHWKCGLCHHKVDAALAWPHPKSPSLDHIIPLAKGGPHLRTNVQLAHLTCNLSKQHRGGGEQLLLIG